MFSFILGESASQYLWSPPHVAAEYGYRDGSGADRVIKRLEEKAKSHRALSRRLKALAKEVPRVDPDPFENTVGRNSTLACSPRTC